MTQDKVSEKVYNEELLGWLPETILDVHAHVGLAEHMGPIAPDRHQAIWALEVGSEQSWETLRANYRMLFPKQRVKSLVFGWVYQETDIPSNNDYVLAGVNDPSNDAKGLFVTRPEWDPGCITEALSRGFAGIKPYPDLAASGSLECSIYDFVPRQHLKALDEASGILMLHLPRKGRLGDPDNVRELLEIAERCARARIIVAHIGRSFCLPTAEKGLPHFADCPNVYFDTSANLNADVFEYALEVVGPDRILFGSDLPITLMRGVREHVGEQYINYTDGPYSWNTNRKTPEEEANYTYYLYEELRALIEACKRTGLGRECMAKMMAANAEKLLG